MVLRHEINSHNREKYIKANDVALKAVVPISKLYPNPDDYITLHPNTKRVQEILKEYNEYEGMRRCGIVINAVARIVINKIEHSPNWRDRFNWWVDKLREGEWKNRALNHPHNGWNEPKPYGGGQ